MKDINQPIVPSSPASEISAPKSLRFWQSSPKSTTTAPDGGTRISHPLYSNISLPQQLNCVKWADGLVIAERYGLSYEYQSRAGYPTNNERAEDTGFWTWIKHHPQIAPVDCYKIWNEPPVTEWADFIRDCIEGSDIRASMLELNTQQIVNSGYGRFEVLETLNIPVSRFFEGNGDSWNRPGDKFGGELFAFSSNRAGFFNAKPRIPRWDEVKQKYQKYESARKLAGEEGNKIFYPAVDELACERLIENFGLPFALTPADYWDVVLSMPKWIRVGITEGAKKAISLTSDGFPCVAILGIGNWSVSGVRVLAPKLYQTLKERREIFYPVVDPIACGRLCANFGLDLVVTCENYWEIALNLPDRIQVKCTASQEQAANLTNDGFPCIALSANLWSTYSGECERILLPKLAELAATGRSIDLWYDMDDPESNAFINGKCQGHKLISALITAGAQPKSRMMFWDRAIGKGIDDAKATIRARGEEIQAWMLETIKFSRHREIYAQIDKAYQLSPRTIERDTTGDYLPDGVNVRSGYITALIADTGAGKTYQINRLIQAGKELDTLTIVFTPTNKLGEQSAYNFNLPHRNSFDDPGEVLAEARQRGGLVLCPDSIGLVKHLIRKGLPYIIVCDEAAKVIEHLSTGATLKQNYASVNVAFAELLAGAKSVIIAEAKLSERDLCSFEALCGKPTLVYRHRKQTAKRDINFYTGAPSAISAALAVELFERLDRGENVVIATDSQRLGDKLERMIRARFPDLNGLRNDATTSYRKEIKALTTTPNQLLAQRQLNWLIYSPACKAGWDLTGFDPGVDGVRHEYHFDAILAFFAVLPTSDHVQMIARYRPNVPVSIACPEMIQGTSDENMLSKPALQQWREEQIEGNDRFCRLSINRSHPSPLQTILDELYIHNTIRNGWEKSIACFSLMERLKADGHTVTTTPISLTQLCQTDPEYHALLVAMAKLSSETGKQIDFDWAALMSSIVLHPEDDAKVAANIERMDAPTPEQRAKAAKIRLSGRFPTVDFDNANTTYYTTRKYGKLASGANLNAKLLFKAVVEQSQREQNTKVLQENIIAAHHLDTQVQQVTLMERVGILALLDGEYSKDSPELLQLRDKCVGLAKPFRSYLGLDFKATQEPVTFFRRLVNKLGLTLSDRRPGGDATRPRLYRVASVKSVLAEIDRTHNLIEDLKERLAIRQSRRYANEGQFVPLSLKCPSQLPPPNSPLPTPTSPLARQIAYLEDVRLPQLQDTFEELGVRVLLYEAALKRLGAASTALINEQVIVDVDGDKDACLAKPEIRQIEIDFRLDLS